jgi:hypothetical protein
MTSTWARWNPTRVLLTTPVLFIFFALVAKPAEKLYSPKNADGLEIISLVLGNEVKANNWTEHDLICFSVDGRNPSQKLVKVLQQDGLNVRSLAEWSVRFSCGFHVYLRNMKSDSPQIARVRAEVADVQGINRGDEHVAIRIREGEYAVRKTEGKWAVAEYVPAK